MKLKRTEQLIHGEWACVKQRFKWISITHAIWQRLTAYSKPYKRWWPAVRAQRMDSLHLLDRQTDGNSWFYGRVVRWNTSQTQLQTRSNEYASPVTRTSDLGKGLLPSGSALSITKYNRGTKWLGLARGISTAWVEGSKRWSGHRAVLWSLNVCCKGKNGISNGKEVYRACSEDNLWMLKTSTELKFTVVAWRKTE